MATRKTSTRRRTTTRKTAKKPPLRSASKGTGNRMPVSVVFRIFVLIVIIIAFFMLVPIIKNLRLNAKATETEQQQEQPEITAQPASPPPKQPEQKPAVSTQTPAPKTPAKEPVKAPNAKPQDQPVKNPQAEKPVTPVQPSTTPAQPSTPPVKPVETRDRSIYLIQKSNMMLVKVNRNINATLTDSINALLTGPTPDEIMREIESCVPEGSRLLSARVDDSTGTARLSFNQEFRYNQRGREGCEAQIKQIVWTATEFPNVRNVQFLIDGKEVDFLSEGVPIRNPIGR